MRLVAIDSPKAVRVRIGCVSCHTSIDFTTPPVYHDEQGPRGADYYCATCATKINMPRRNMKLIDRITQAENELKSAGIKRIERAYVEQKGLAGWEEITVEDFIRRTEWAGYVQQGTATEVLISEGTYRMTPWAFYRAVKEAR